MPLSPGARLGPYEIVGLLGAGGMGEVYKARDARLDRTVAVKVLLESVAADAGLRARFEREARAIAALSHPHICTVHDVGRQPSNGLGPAIDYIVMEHLDGETLADRLRRTGAPLPIEQVLAIGVAIVDALDKAHRAGIVHRDLKPANVMLTKSGPKLLDFGLAKGIAPSGDGADVTRALTDTHTILGTLLYMAPEQVEGRDADGRSDLWSLGVMLYEMATGTRPFAGDSAASVLSAILRDHVPLVSTRQPLAPAGFDHIVDRCLQKDPDERWQNAGDVRRELQWIATGGSGAGRTAQASTIPRPKRAGWRVAAACLVVGASLGAAAMLMRPAPIASTAPRTVLSIAAPPDVRLGATYALSPDGRHFTFVGLGGEGPPMLWLRALDETAARSIAGTEGASYPFWSPRSDVIGFFAGGKLKTIPLAGGVARTLATVANGRGGAWSAEGIILFSGQNNPVYRISEQGGAATPATAIEFTGGVTGHRWPTFVDPKHFVYTVQGGAADTGIYLASLDSKATTKLNTAYSNTLFRNGRLLFVSDNMLIEQSLDLGGLRLVGAPKEVVGPVTYTAGLGYAPISMASNDMLAYTPISASGALSQLVWLDPQGKRLGSLGADVGLGRDVTYNERLSRDGRTVVVSAFRAATADIWLIDLTRVVASRFTFSDANDQMAIFSPAGDEVVYGSNGSGVFNMYRKRVDGSSPEVRFLTSATHNYPEEWSHDGKTIFFLNLDPKTQSDIWRVNARDGTKPTPVLATPFNEFSPRLSPDDHWLAYTSDESGQPEVYVQKFPIASGKVQISTQGGTEPVWSGNGRELFYVAANQTLNVVTVQTAPEFSAGRPTKVSDTVIDTSTGGFQTTHYTVTADGQRFLANVAAASPDPPAIVMNWSAQIEHVLER